MSVDELKGKLATLKKLVGFWAMKQIRLSNEDIGIIVKQIKNIFGDSTKAYIFGSRAKANKKGGDVDILIESETAITLDQKLSFLARLELSGIQRKVDLLVVDPKTHLKQIHKDALKEGVRIV
jgi:predicted nucleotidyltransferase